MKKELMTKIGKIVGDILLYAFLLLGVFAVVITLASKKGTDGAAEIFGYQMRIISSDSMAPCDQTDVSQFEIGSLPLRSMVFVEVIPQEETDQWYRDLKVGDVLTFRYVYTRQVTITHRITSIVEKETGGFLIQLEGDNKNADAQQLTQIIDTSIAENTNYVIGKVVGQSRALGFVTSLLQEPVGLVLIIIVPCLIIIVLEILRIISVLGADRKKKEQHEKQQKDQELEELRRRLAQLEQQAQPPVDTQASEEITQEECSKGQPEEQPQEEQSQEQQKEEERSEEKAQEQLEVDTAEDTPVA